VLPYFYFFISFEFSVFFLLCILGFFVYCSLLVGIFSKRKYGLIGAIRSSSQSVSYEVVFSIFLVLLIMHWGSFSFFVFFFIDLVFLIILFLLLILVECNRAPFDFSEGESELVRGFNVEFSSIGFVFLFLSEYGFLIFFSILFSTFFDLGFVFIFLFFLFLIWVRRSFPRFRYDLLMYILWFVILPIILFLFLYFVLFYS